MTRSSLTFNMVDGFLEAVCRGQKLGLLTSADYANLTQCETVDDMKMHLAHTDYGPYLANEPSPISTTTLAERCLYKLVKDFNHIRCQAVEPLATFLDYITYAYMIDNIILLITGTLHGKDISELITKCHPLGMFESIESLSVVSSPRDLYATVLIDTPLAPYFAKCLSIEDLNEMNVEVIRQTLYKAYLEDFYQFCHTLGGTTAEVMGPILEFEADRRIINITLNSFGTELSASDRKKLYPDFGRLVPEGVANLVKAEDPEQVRAVVDPYVTYRTLFMHAETTDRSLEDCFYQHEMKLNSLAFLVQYGYGVFYAIVKLREQEIRNLQWISECIAQDVRSKINHYILPIGNQDS